MEKVSNAKFRHVLMSLADVWQGLTPMCAGYVVHYGPTILHAVPFDREKFHANRGG